MSFKNIRQLPSPVEVVGLVPLSEESKKAKAARDAEIKKIVEGKSGKFLLIIGPCSAEEEGAVCDYVLRLAKVQEKVAKELLIVPRIYTNKPRTTGEGYKGMLHQPNPEEAPNMLDGILSIRKMHVRAIAESGLSAADEMLYPDNLVYMEDLLSYIAIGARSVENQQHRLTSSGIDLPVGMKNPTSGDLTVMYNSVNAAQASHNYIYQNHEVQTSGNPLAHAIMRGSVNKHGESIPNYHFEDLIFSSELYLKRGLLNPMIVVDTNHANSRKLYYEQPRIAKEVLHSRRYNSTVRQLVRGLLIESYIEPGNQEISENRIYGKSITDACLGWTETEELIYYIAENIW
ncbi:MAG: 3-deoxy-7-phosphoheptulonate synthase [Clostridiales bacterium]|nr:3-deoxy-7-phosphoheptulonate synthase [Clostridiales bacterium]